jgi:hypothetical protein
MRNASYGVSSHLSGRALARAVLGWEFPVSTLSIVERVPSPTITHVSSRPPKIPYGGVSPVGFPEEYAKFLAVALP